MKAYSYARWSDPRQGKGDTEDRQLSAARGYADEHGLLLDTSLIDRGISGYTGANRKRGDLGRFLEMVELGIVNEGDYLLVDSMDRLSRLPLNEAAAQLLNLANAGVRIVTINDGMIFDRNVELPTMINAVLKMQGAHDYSKELGRKVKRGHASAKRRAREEGRIYSKTGPGWLVLDQDRTEWIQIPDRVALVRRIFEWADAGGLGQRVIANRLNSSGIRPFRKGKGWHETAVRKLLQNRMVLGEYQPRFLDGSPDGEAIAGYYGSGIIAPDQFHRIQARFGRRRGRGNGLEVFNNLLQGLCRCGNCDATVGVAVRSKDKRPLYICRNTAEGMICDNRTRYRVAEFEDALLSHLADADLRVSETSSPERVMLEHALGERAELQRRIQTFVARMEDPRWGSDEFMMAHHRQRISELQAKDREISRLTASVDRFEAQHSTGDHQAVVREVRADLKTLTGRELYDARARLSAALRAIVDRVYFAHDPWGDPVITVWMLGGAKICVVRPKDGSRIYDMVETIVAEGQNDPAFLRKYTGGDPIRERKLKQLAAARSSTEG